VISAQLSPRAGKAVISTRIRLAGTQKLMAIAELSDGTYWSDTADVVVTLAACLEDLI
jgi:sulfur-oxidizing protein SoxY